MKLLLDQNMAPRLAGRLSDLYPGSAHVQDLGLDTASDDDIWDHVRDNDFVVLTKDSDFGDMGVVRGVPAQGPMAATRELHERPGRSGIAKQLRGH
jgi:predicted nuclease of predicted toxin-antitoxin system